MTKSLKEFVNSHREDLERLVDEGPAPIQVPIVTPPEGLLISETQWSSVHSKVLIKRKYMQLAPWAIREFRYVANVFVDQEDPDVPLVFGEWKIWYKNPEILDPELPPHIDDQRKIRWLR